MRSHEACSVIAEITYKPNWKIWATPERVRYEGHSSVNLHFAFTAPDSDVRYAPLYRAQTRPGQSFELDVTAMTRTDLIRAVMDKIVETEIHEAREFFAVGDLYWKPFHPHTPEGIEAWGRPETNDMARYVAALQPRW